MAMSHPFTLKLEKITCHATEDFVGSDDLVGVMGPDRFSIGAFKAGESRALDLERTIPRGVGTLEIFEGDVIGPDDALLSIDLTREMDTERVVASLVGDARYVINFLVASQAD
jgi:hypothetical protein